MFQCEPYDKDTTHPPPCTPMSWISGISKLASETAHLFSPHNVFPPQTSFEQERPALLVSRELEKAIEDCKKKVAQISKACRGKNRRYR